MSQIPAAPNVECTDDIVGDVPGIWCRPINSATRVILYLHGGWFVSGTPHGYRNFVGHLAARADAPALIPQYRLAPEHQFPAAVEDVHDAYQGLVDRGVREITIVGDSAGGQLALELLARIVREIHGRCPSNAVLLSPVTDLSQSGATWESRDAMDLLFTKQQVRELIDLYLGDTDRALPLSSRTRDFSRFPAMRIHTGDDEVLLDDSLRLAQRASDMGVDVRLDVWEGMLHVFPSSFAQFEAADAALNEIAAFIRNS